MRRRRRRRNRRHAGTGLTIGFNRVGAADTHTVMAAEGLHPPIFLVISRLLYEPHKVDLLINIVPDL